MIERDVVITGMGLVTPLGGSVFANWRHVLKGRTGIGYFPDGRRPPGLSWFGRVEDFALPLDIPRKLLNQMRFLNRGAILGFGAAHAALAQAGTDASCTPCERRGLYIGTGDLTMAGYDFMFPAVHKGTGGTFRQIDHRRLNAACLTDVNPFFLLESLHNNLFSTLSAIFELKGPNACLSGQSPCGLQALECACRAIRMGDADQALAVGYGNWITPVPLYEMEGLGLLSRCRAGAASYRPFDRRRDGFIPGEGGAALCLESGAAARRRGVPVYGKVVGTGNCVEFSARPGLGVPEVSVLRSMELALEESRGDVEGLAFISPHGSGSRPGDRSELCSIQTLLGGRASEIPVVGFKPYTGHMGAASDLAEVVLGLKALEEQMVPATLNFAAAEDAFSTMRISSALQPCLGSRFLCTALGMGGRSTAVVLEV